MPTALHHIVLHKLNEQPLSGYSLCKEIKRSTGQRPSFGSIYPLLENLAKKGIVTVKKDGRKKIYTLTQKGKIITKEMHSKREELINELIARNRMFCEITGSDPAPMIAILERLKKGEDPLGAVAKNGIRLRDSLFKIAQQKKIEKHHKEINKILEDAIKKLEKL